MTVATSWSLRPQGGSAVRLADPIPGNALSTQDPSGTKPARAWLAAEPGTPDAGSTPIPQPGGSLDDAAPRVPKVHTVEDGRADGGEPDVEAARHRTPPDIKRLEIAYHVLNAADLTTTLICLNRSNCEEQNPIYGRNPNKAVIIGAKVFTSAVHYWAMRRLAPENPGLARAFGYVAVIVQGGVVGFNLTQLF